MITQIYPQNVAIPMQGEITIFRNKADGFRYYKRANNTIVKMDDELNGETFNIYEKNINRVINLTEDVMETLDTDKTGIDLVTVKFCCKVTVAVVGGGGGGARGISGYSGASGASASGSYAEFVQHTQDSNVSVAPGRAIEYLTDNPAGVYDTIGITTGAGPAGQGTAFQLPIGFYTVDYENSNDGAWSLAIYQGVSNTVLAINTETIAGSTTGTTWIHGRAIIESSAGNTWFMISPVVGTQAIPTAGTATGEYIARLTIMKIA